MPWLDYVFPGDMEKVVAEFEVMVKDQRPILCEWRVIQSWKIPHTRDTTVVMPHTWILSSAYPEITEDGVVRSVMGVNTDITHQKWAEAVQ